MCLVTQTLLTQFNKMTKLNKDIFKRDVPNDESAAEELFQILSILGRGTLCAVFQHGQPIRFQRVRYPHSRRRIP